MIVFKQHEFSYLYNSDIIITLQGYAYDRLHAHHRNTIITPVEYVTTSGILEIIRGNVKICNAWTQWSNNQYCTTLCNERLSESAFCDMINGILY